jgi:hypothetical protein
VSTIGPPPELTAYLRGQLAALAAASPVSARDVAASKLSTSTVAKGRPGTTPAKPGATPRRTRPAEDLATALARRITAIDKADPDRRRKAFRVFLESVMLDEWGAELINDPSFHQLVDKVQAQMESRADLRALMQEASARLLAE